MQKIKKAIVLLVCLLGLIASLDFFKGIAQTKRGAGTQKKTPATDNPKKVNMVPLPVRQGVDYSKFDHAMHSPDCQSCHTSGKYGDPVTDWPKHDTCENCHAISPAFTLIQRGAFCLICHEKNLKTVKSEFPEQKPDQFVTRLPHSVHVGLKAKDSNKYGDPTYGEGFSEDDLKLQQVARKSGCLECHVKDGKEQKEENFSEPGHPECARCHGLAPGNVLPIMNDCAGCHKPFLASYEPVTDIVPKFRHDRDHEKDTRPDAKKGETLDCKFCHKETAASKRIQDITRPFVSNCTICHFKGKKASGHELTPEELKNMRPDPEKK